MSFTLKQFDLMQIVRYLKLKLFWIRSNLPTPFSNAYPSYTTRRLPNGVWGVTMFKEARKQGDSGGGDRGIASRLVHS